MLRTFTTLAVIAAAGTVATQASAETLTLNLAGKSPAAAYAAIERAAKDVCRLSAADQVYSIYAESGCVQNTIAATLAKVDPAVTEYAKTRDAFLKLASN